VPFVSFRQNIFYFQNFNVSWPEVGSADSAHTKIFLDLIGSEDSPKKNSLLSAFDRFVTHFIKKNKKNIQFLIIG
jgi:hypothetical protein